RCDQVEGAAQFSVRGSIVDIFSVSERSPFRIELWGDEVDSLCIFDTESQRRTSSLDKITVAPAAEIICSKDKTIEAITALRSRVRGKLADKICTLLDRDIDALRGGLTLNNMDKYYNSVYSERTGILDYFDEDNICLVCEYANCIEKAKAVTTQLREDSKLLIEEGVLFNQTADFLSGFELVMKKALEKKALFADTFMRSHNDIRFKHLINTDCRQTSGWGGDMKSLLEELSAFCDAGYSTVLLAGSEKTLPIIIKDLTDNGINATELTDDCKLLPSWVYVRTGSVSGGFEYPDIKCAMITQMKALSSKKKPKLKRPENSKKINSIADISSGDLVVHSMYGIGRFAGIRNLETNGVKKDYITIKYAGTDVLYVPVTQLDLVSKYIAPGDEDNVKLNKLNSMEWSKTKSRVRKAVKDMAEQLTKLYAERQLAKGYAFSEDSEWQTEFEERFEYTETDDQLRSINEIKQDMQKAVPMDRLLCGDVGFGKTEVALRAAFKCMLDSKQVAILVPTTVLAWQHYQTAVKRFEHFPVTVELLSRFRKPKEQKEILKKLARGEVDIVIGTHRLVQDDVAFRDLGLVIVDEEQRFGVAHKEKFKEKYKNVDILTLSATPIPRTLNMALTGIRDMSVIEEPPQDRYPVQTYVLEHNDGVIAQAIAKELRRGGQVYYLFNRVETIAHKAAMLSKMLPEARIGIAHGQMNERELSEIWRQLIEHEIDILVCTTIIETGVDVSNVNTLIIEDSDRMGLSQLYQLRGRVGRSNKRAFAYLTFRRGKLLSEIAEKRLNAVKEFTQFGSGFHIAMRDLEIRGAGSVLSGHQHGHMEAVGYDMYLRLLSEAMASLKGEAMPHSPEDCLVDIAIDAYIPEKYIESLPQRIDAYRKIALVVTEEDSRDVVDELIDRFGDPPKSVMGLINIALMRNMASRLGIKEISQRGDSIFFFVDSPEVSQITALMKKYKSRVKFNDKQKPYISVTLTKHQKPSVLMNEVIGVMRNNALPA
ncbi:MAG: transcription-repair coupling factor, partial [Ruminococcus sp.]|nr:transcription-repair coupling factor [Ruminococcus sp.]